jgi:hypothetical protein
MPFLKKIVNPLPDARSAARTAVISSHSARTRGSSLSPWAWMFARTSIASSPRSIFASQRGLRGRNGIPNMRIKHGTNCMPHAVRKEAGPEMNEQP